MIHLGDITKINGAEIEPVDVITGGSPCQDLSVAGKRAGLEGERSGLFMEQIRVVKEMRYADRLRGRTDELIRPRYMVWENVPGAFSSNGGKDFQAVLTEIVKIVEPDAPELPVPNTGGGPTQTASMEWAQTGSPFPWLGNFTTHSIGVSLKDGKDYAFWLTSTDLQRRGYCLTLNLSERPRAANPTKLSEILEQNPDPKYSLSSRACQGILNRAERRGKELPAELKAALTAQSVCKETELTAAIPQAVTEQAGDGGQLHP